LSFWFLLYFFRSLDMPSKNKTANPPMYAVFPFCFWFCSPQCCIFLKFGFIFLIFNDRKKNPECSQQPTIQKSFLSWK
jgi:hypothetical protein